MSESVTAGPLGGIPATSGVYTAAQIDEIVSGVNAGIDAAFSGFSVAEVNATLSGVNEFIGSAVPSGVSGSKYAYAGGMVSGAVSGVAANAVQISGLSGSLDGLVYAETEDDMDENSGSGIDGDGEKSLLLNKDGASVTNVRFNDGTNWHTVLMDDSFSGMTFADVNERLSGINSFVDRVTSGSSGYDKYDNAGMMLKYAYDDTYRMMNILIGSGESLYSGYDGWLSGMLASLMSGYMCGYDPTESGFRPSKVPFIYDDGDPSTEFCQAVYQCLSGQGVVTEDDLCEKVSGCISGMGINWAAVNNAISGLQNAVCGLTGRISGMVDDLAETIADALTAADAIIEHEELPDEIKRKVQRAKDKANDPVVFPVIRDDVKRKAGGDILNDIVPALDDVKDAVSDGVAVDPNDPDLPPETPIDVEDVAAADTTAGDTAENASDASDALSSENGNLEQYGRSLL